MKHLLLPLIIPLTIISLLVFTKWWYVLPVDAPDTMMMGFPLPYVSDGWHTSMSLQIFIIEFFIDLAVHFLVWLLIIFFIHRYIWQINIPKFLIIILWVSAIVTSSLVIFIATLPDQIIKFKRDWDMQVIDTGYKFIWQQQKRPVIGDGKILEQRNNRNNKN
ncbi:hypothetical protein CHRYSEOSP005_19560 [Chryseobacterium sp. Alg-005]|uniref:hypothetical protein n=1 Tax=Chryseobacterium sp. Alg-005 TaxID=3159516 RepID=UPI0035558081